jgi:hypothetical protein
MAELRKGRVSGRSTTKPASTGREVGLTNPFDRDYICDKFCTCGEKTDVVDKLGRQLKQRCVTKRIQLDEEETGRLAWRYKAEVGYYMSKPVRPMMSKDQPNRPSRFPIGRVMGEGLLLRSLEGKTQKGMLRIPDVTILKITGLEIEAMRASGKIDWNRFMPVRQNIETILEIKFPGDKLTDGQIHDYPKIAGEDKFRLLESDDCDCKQRRRRVPVKEPVRMPVVTPMRRESTEDRKWYQSASPRPAPAPAPQPVRPGYGPVVSASGGVPLSDYLKSGGEIVGGVIVIAGAIGLLYFTGGLSAPASAEGIAAGVALIVTGVAVHSTSQHNSSKDNEA